MNSLYNEDCLNILKNMPDNSVDLIVTDPPYRVISGGNKNEKWKSGWNSSVLSRNDGKIFDHNNIKFSEWIPEAFRVLKNDSDFYCMTNVMNVKEIITEAEKAGFKLHNILVWEKNNATANRWYMKNCEFTLYFYKGNAKTINNPGSKQVHQFNNILGEKQHPTEKPVELMKFYVENSSNEGDLVLDPFMGVGATGVACNKAGRNFIGIEIDEKYFNIAKHRIEESKSERTEQLTLW